jgi:hypothetical protein
VTPSHAAAGDELAGIARGLRDAGTGVLQLISDFADVDAEFAIVRRLLVESGRPLSLSVIQMPNAPRRWAEILDRVEAAGAEGLPILGQVCGPPIGGLLGLELSVNPFIACAGHRRLAGAPFAVPARGAARPGAAGADPGRSSPVNGPAHQSRRHPLRQSVLMTDQPTTSRGPKPRSRRWRPRPASRRRRSPTTTWSRATGAT